MINRLFLSLAFFSATLVSVHSQVDVNLFDFWTYYADSENAMYKSSCQLAFKQLEERKKTMAKLQTTQDYLARQEAVRKKLYQLVGPFPEKTPLNARVTGVLRMEDYQVEKLLYESLPGYYVTAALFLPENLKGKAPAIIYASGHTANGFRSDTYQHIILNLVKKGFIVLAFDPIGQGERLQYGTDKEGKARFGPTTEHSYPGAQCYLSGYSPTKYFIWDGIRSLDYLLTREEVDPERIGMTGRSGGGTQTAYTAALDDRILAAAPECFITSMEYVLKSIGPQDAEQNLIHMISEGLDHADLLEVRAPRPGLMITTTRDFFSIQGARETFAEVRQFYEALEAGEQIAMVEDDEGHASTKRNREAMYAFFQKHLDNPGSPADQDVELINETELWVTESGQLASSIKSESIYSLNRKIARNQMATLKLSRTREDLEEHLDHTVIGAKRCSGFILPEEHEKAVFSGRYVTDTYVLETYLIPGGGNYMLPAAMFRPLGEGNREVVLLLDEQGMEHAIKKDSLLIASLLKQGYSLLVFDVRGTGSLGPGYLKGDAYIGNTSFNQWFAGILTNKSLVGMRVEDIFRMTHFTESEFKEFEAISAISRGACGSELLHAAAFDKRIQKIGLIHPFLSFADMVLHREYAPAYIPSTVAGAIQTYDLPDLMAALCPRSLLIINPRSETGEPAGDEQSSCRLVYPRMVYDQKGFEKHFRQVVLDKGQPVYEELLHWLKQQISIANPTLP